MASLDPRPALVVIDLQNGIVALPPAAAAQEVIGNAASLASAFRARRLPVVLVNVAGAAPGRSEWQRPGGAPPAGWTELRPELGASPGDLRVTKTRWNAFFGSDLDADLRRHGVTQVVLAGIATSMGVESTARSAHEHGYNVALVTDAMTDPDIDAHHNSITRVFPKLGERLTTAALLDALS